MNKLGHQILILCLLLCTCQVLADTQVSKDSRLVIVLKENAMADGQLTEQIKSKFPTLHKFSPYQKGIFARTFGLKASRLELSKALSAQQLNQIQSIEEVFEVDEQSITPSTQSDASDPFSPYQWALSNNGQSLTSDIDDIHSETILGVKGMDIDYPADGVDDKIQGDVIVAVLDSGLDLDHPDIKNKIFKNSIECDNGALPWRPTEDRDHNGFIGDCMGWNFTAKNAGDHRPYDDAGHGTHVSGIIAAERGNAIGIKGLSRKIKILPIKVTHGKSSGGAKGFSDNIAKGILYAISMHAKVINLSLGWPRSMDTEYLRQAFAEAYKQNIVIVAAAGNNNSGRAIYPCSYETVICVASMGVNGALSGFSNYGGFVDLMAPGEQILSIIPTKLEPEQFSVNGLDIKSGTSQAAPYVSGIAAILRGVYPNSSAMEILQKLMLGALPVPQTGVALKGAVQLGHSLSLEITQEQLVTPKFKSSQDVQFDAQTGVFEIRFQLINWGKDLEKIVLAPAILEHTDSLIPFEGDNVVLDSSSSQIEISNLTRNAIKDVSIKGIIKNHISNSEKKLALEVIYPDGKRQRYLMPIFFSRKLQANDSDVKIIALKRPVNAPPILNNIAGRKEINLASVQDPFRRRLAPEYYQTFRQGTNLEFMLYRLAHDENGDHFTSLSSSIPNAVKVMSVFKIDLNYDGTDDYLIRSLAQVGSDRYIIYTYLNSNLLPLFGQEELPAQLHFRPEVAVLEPRAMAFIPYTTNGITVATPVFLTSGKLPKLDQNPDPWAPQDTTTRERAYYFAPDFKAGVTTVRSLENYQFVENIRAGFFHSWQSDFSWKGPLSQSYSEYMAKKLRIILSISSGGASQNMLLTFTSPLQYKFSGELNTHDGKFSLPLNGYLKVPLTSINQNEVEYSAGDGFFGIQNDTFGQALSLQNSSNNQLEGMLEFTHPLARDHILGVMASFHKNDTFYYFYQTKGNLGLIQKQGNQVSNYLHAIDRVSFLPGTVFNEIFYPVTWSDREESYPAYYVDATQLNAGQLYVLVAGEKGIFSPLINSISVPDKCVPLNPASWPDGEFVTLLCDTQAGQFELWYVPIGVW